MGVVIGNADNPVWRIGADSRQLCANRYATMTRGVYDAAAPANGTFRVPRVCNLAPLHTGPHCDHYDCKHR